MKFRCLLLSLGLLAIAPVAMTDPAPSLELLELLGQLSDIEELGVDIDALIEKRLSPEQKIEYRNEGLELLILEEDL